MTEDCELSQLIARPVSWLTRQYLTGKEPIPGGLIGLLEVDSRRNARILAARLRVREEAVHVEEQRLRQLSRFGCSHRDFRPSPESTRLESVPLRAQLSPVPLFSVLDIGCANLTTQSGCPRRGGIFSPPTSEMTRSPGRLEWSRSRRSTG